MPDMFYCFKSSRVHLENLYFMSEERVSTLVRILYGDDIYKDVSDFFITCSVGSVFFAEDFEIEVLEIN